MPTVCLNSEQDIELGIYYMKSQTNHFHQFQIWLNIQSWRT